MSRENYIKAINILLLKSNKKLLKRIFNFVNNVYVGRGS